MTDKHPTSWAAALCRAAREARKPLRITKATPQAPPEEPCRTFEEELQAMREEDQARLEAYFQRLADDW